MELEYKKLKMAASSAYYCDFKVRDFRGNVAAATLMVDTGSSTTYIPRSTLKQLSPIEAKRCLARFPNGKAVRTNRWRLCIVIDGRTYCPENGIAVTPNETGFLGMDILSQMNILISGGVLLMEDSGS